MPPAEVAAHFRQILREARIELGPEIAPLVEHVCCHDGTMEEVGIKVGNRGGSARRKGAKLVKGGLDVLVEHYNIEPPRRARISGRRRSRYDWRFDDEERWRNK